MVAPAPFSFLPLGSMATERGPADRDTRGGNELPQAATIGLAVAQDLARVSGCNIEVRETPNGLAIFIEGRAIHSRRQDLLTFLTVDGAVNYIRRHLASPAGLTTRLCVSLHAE